MTLPTLYTEMQQAGSTFDERSDCAVIAVALVSGQPYSVVHEAFAALGRRAGGRSQFRWIRCAVEEFGLVADVAVGPLLRAEYARGGARFTARTIGRAFPTGRYLVHFRGHVAAMVDGEILDWTAGRCHRVTQLWRIDEPAEDVEAEYAPPSVRWQHTDPEMLVSPVEPAAEPDSAEPDSAGPAAERGIRELEKAVRALRAELDEHVRERADLVAENTRLASELAEARRTLRVAARLFL